MAAKWLALLFLPGVLAQLSDPVRSVLDIQAGQSKFRLRQAVRDTRSGNVQGYELCRGEWGCPHR